MKDTTDEMLDRLRDNWLPAEDLPVVSVDEYLRRLEANWIEPVAQEAAPRGGRFLEVGDTRGHGVCIVRIIRGGDKPYIAERHYFFGDRLIYTNGDGNLYVDVIEHADVDTDADTDADADASPNRDALPNVDAAPDVDGDTNADSDGDVDGGGDANNPISRHRAARRAERAYFDNPARLAGLPRAPGACTFVWRDAPGAEGS